MFRVSQHPSSGVLKTVPAASGTGFVQWYICFACLATINFKLMVPCIVIQCEYKSNRCNSIQIFIHSKTTLHVSGVTAPIIRSIKNCTRSLYSFYTLVDGCCDTRNMQSSFAVNKYLLTVASVGFLFTQIAYSKTLSYPEDLNPPLLDVRQMTKGWIYDFH